MTRPVTQLLGYARVQLPAGAAADVAFDVPTARLAFSDRRMVRVVEPGEIRIAVGRSCQDPVLTGTVTLTGPVHEVGVDDPRVVRVEVSEVTR